MTGLNCAEFSIFRVGETSRTGIGSARKRRLRKQFSFFANRTGGVDVA
jgi:hypothetical protein